MYEPTFQMHLNSEGLSNQDKSDSRSKNIEFDVVNGGHLRMTRLNSFVDRYRAVAPWLYTVFLIVYHGELSGLGLTDLDAKPIHSMPWAKQRSPQLTKQLALMVVWNIFGTDIVSGDTFSTLFRSFSRC